MDLRELLGCGVVSVPGGQELVHGGLQLLGEEVWVARGRLLGVLAHVDLRHQRCHLERQRAIEWQSAARRLLRALVAQQQPLLVRFTLGAVSPPETRLEAQLDGPRVLKLAGALFAQRHLPLGDDVAHLGRVRHKVLAVSVDWVVARQGESRLRDVTAPNLLHQRR